MPTSRAKAKRRRKPPPCIDEADRQRRNRASKKKWYEAHKEHCAARAAKYYEEHNAEIRAQQASYKAERNAWKYSGKRRKGILEEGAGISVINEFELRCPSYRVNGRWELWNEKGELL